MNTLSRYMKETGENGKVENLPAAELDHPLWKFFMDIRKKNEQEYEPDSISGFQRSIQRYLSEGQRLWKVEEGSRCETKCFKTCVLNCSTRFCAARVIKSTDKAPEVDLNEITGSVSSPKKTMPYNKLLTNLACLGILAQYGSIKLGTLTSWTV